MSRDELSEMEQLDELAGELAAAGRLARTVSARGERPDPAFAMSLRGRLLRELPNTPAMLVPSSVGTTARPAPATAEPADDRPVPPTRPLGAPEPFVERRHLGSRPFSGERRIWSQEERERALVEAAAAAADERGGDDGKIVALRPSVRWRIPTRVAPSRWVAAGLAACLVAVSLLYGVPMLWPTVRGDASAEEAVAATLVRDGATSPLTAGEELREGDEIDVGDAGSATLRLESSYARLASGATLRIDRIGSKAIVVEQLGGRVYHRVVVNADASYEVRTASVAWTAHGTAFDLDRRRTGADREEVRALALEHGIVVAGPSLRANIDQGSAATVVLGLNNASASSPRIAAIDTATLADAWLATNARLDARLGLPLGELAALVTPSPEHTAELTPQPTGEPVATDAPVGTEGPALTEPPAPTQAVTPKPTPKPTLKPTPKPTPKVTPTPKPTATPVGPANLRATKNADGSYTFRWSAYTGPIDFNYYKFVYAPAGTIPDYPTGKGTAVAIDTTQTSWTTDLDPGSWWIRVQAVYYPGGSPAVAGQTDVLKLTVTAPAPPPMTPPPPVSLGAITATDKGGGLYRLAWSPFTGSIPAALDGYKIALLPWSSGADPSYVGGNFTAYYYTTSVPWEGSIASGDWAIRVEAIYYYNSTLYAAGRTTVYHLTVP